MPKPVSIVSDMGGEAESWNIGHRAYSSGIAAKSHCGELPKSKMEKDQCSMINRPFHGGACSMFQVQHLWSPWFFME
jgi:hypothetical protein